MSADTGRGDANGGGEKDARNPRFGRGYRYHLWHRLYLCKATHDGHGFRFSNTRVWYAPIHRVAHAQPRTQAAFSLPKMSCTRRANRPCLPRVIVCTENGDSAGETRNLGIPGLPYYGILVPETRSLRVRHQVCSLNLVPR